MSQEALNSDLPLMSNVKDIFVHHYMFDFKCDFPNKCFKCFSVLFLEPVDDIAGCLCSENVTSQDKSSAFDQTTFILILDSYQINIHRIEAIDCMIPDVEELKFQQKDIPSLKARNALNYSIHEWCLKVWADDIFCKHKFPKLIRIEYSTLPSSLSLLWVKDQNSKPTVFSYGANINNRSLFPCQEPPIAMATWEAVVTVPDQAIVLMSGDEEAQVSHTHGYSHYYYYTNRVLPLSTLSLAIGYWEKHDITSTYDVGPRCRIFATPQLIDKSIAELFEYIPHCLQKATSVLGPYPFPRIDFLVVPPTFGSLGMANPNLIFLSQSLLTGNGDMCSRVAHEIAHGWFGLLIGALDWTEEWLSEGFATFLEDHFHVWTTHMANMDDYLELKAVIRKKILLDEISNTDENLQIMRASKGEVHTSQVDGENVTVVKNAQNSTKNFMQVHYIKGYFLLKYFYDRIGSSTFFPYLRDYILKYSGKLVTSKEFIEMFMKSDSLKSFSTIETISNDWLNDPTLPTDILNFHASPSNELSNKTTTETQKWKKFNRLHQKKNRAKKLRLDFADFSSDLTSEQMILLLENMLDEDKIHPLTLKSLNEWFLFKDQNVEVLHRWLELVVKHKYKCEYGLLKDFLINHLAMGVYLYGEAIFSGNSQLIKISKECYQLLEPELEPNFRSTLSQMFFDAGITLIS